MSNIYRKHPLSVAISMALLAAAATAAGAAEQTSAAAEPAGLQGPVQQDGTPSATPAARSTKPAGSAVAEEGPKTDDLSEITVVGVRESQIRAIELKRLAPSIQDSISAESIGQLPDVTITDALQRITGVQINRDAGVGTSVDVRGLPQVGTMLNGEVFITPDQIDSQQPDFTTLPATLFNQVDVIKSSTASQTSTRHQRALESAHLSALGFAAWIHLQLCGGRGTGKRLAQDSGRRPAALIAYNADGRWGLQVSGDFSRTRTRTQLNRGPGPVWRHPAWRERGQRGRLQRLSRCVERRADSFPDRAEPGRQCRRER